MSNSIRTFVAAKIPVLPKLRPVLRSLAMMKWPVVAAAPDQLHVTLKFLGETPGALITRIQDQLAESVLGQSPFTLRVVGLGAFPQADRPAVIWAGLNDADHLVALARRIEMSLEPLGFSRESRPFHPHMTLARIKNRPPGELFELLRQSSNTEFGTADIGAIELIRSVLDRDGARYTTLSKFEFR